MLLSVGKYAVIPEVDWRDALVFPLFSCATVLLVSASSTFTGEEVLSLGRNCDPERLRSLPARTGDSILSLGELDRTVETTGLATLLSESLPSLPAASCDGTDLKPVEIRFVKLASTPVA
jgi:hypothetical protein